MFTGLRNQYAHQIYQCEREWRKIEIPPYDRVVALMFYVLEYSENHGILNTFGISKIAIFARNQSQFQMNFKH